MSGSRRGVSRAAAWYARWGDLLTARRVLLLAGAGVLAASGVFGGLRQVEAEPDRDLVAGRTIDAPPFELTVNRARTISEVPGLERRGTYVLVDVTLRNTDTSSIEDAPLDVIRGVVGLGGDEPAYLIDRLDETDEVGQVLGEVRVRSDATTLTPVIPPGLTYETAFIWELTGELPDEVEVVVRARTKRQSNIDDRVMWFDPRVIGRLTLPVEPEDDA